MRASRSLTLEPASRIECSTSERAIADVRVDRRVGADVGVGDPGAGADDRRAADDRALEPRARLDHDPALDPASPTSSPSIRALDVLEDQPVGLEHVVELAGVLPPAA